MKIIGISGNLGSGKDTVADILVKTEGLEVLAFADQLKRVAMYVFNLPASVLWGESAWRNVPQYEWYAENPPEEWLRRFRQYARLTHRLFDNAPEPVTMEQMISKFEDVVEKLRERGREVTPRYILQLLGTEFGRALWDEVWLDFVHGVTEMVKREGLFYRREYGVVREETPWSEPKGFVIQDMRFPNEARFVDRRLQGRRLFVDATKRAPVPAHLQHASEPKRSDFKTMELEGSILDEIDADIDNNGALEELPGKVAKAVEIAFAKPAQVRGKVTEQPTTDPVIDDDEIEVTIEK